MPTSEWGPKKIRRSGNVLEVARLTGGQLQEVSARVSGYLQTHPTAARGDIISAVVRTYREVPIFEAGLDILNQLSVVGRNGSSARLVVVREDRNNIVERGNGQRKPHRFYEIDWLNEPKFQTENLPRGGTSVAKSTSFGNAQRSERARRQERKRREREEREERRHEREKLAHEGEAVDAVIIDTVREVGESAINMEQVKIELDGEGNAVLLLRWNRWEEYRAVNRTTGEYRAYVGKQYDGDDEWSKRMREYMDKINPLYLSYFNYRAAQAEGKEAPSYLKLFDIDTCVTTFEKALAMGMIKVETDQEKGTVFEYLSNIDTIFDLQSSSFAEMDLERNIVVIDSVFGLPPRERPIRPDFGEFLKRLKARLDGQ